MARLRLLFALLLMAVGTTFGAFALSGYYEPHMTHGQPVAAPSAAASPVPAEKPQPTLSPPRHRFVAVDEPPPAAPPAKPKTVAKAVPVKTGPVVQAPPAVRRPQPAAAPWPWDPFRN